jgi:type IV pilus assembly protein PilE
MATGFAQRGLTLIELVIVITVIGILGAIAVPTYRQYVIRASRTDAMTALLRVQAAEEKFFLANNTYTDLLTDAPPAGLGLVPASEHGKYELSIALADGGQAYTATATAAAGEGQDRDTDCGSFSITEGGVRSVSGDQTVAECWR